MFPRLRFFPRLEFQVIQCARVAAVASKLREIYARKVIKPAEVAEDIRQEPTLAQNSLSKDVENSEGV